MLFRLKTSERSSNIIKNVAYITVIKGISLAVSFMIIPITIDYVSKSTYGIWLTMFSIVNWLGMFDIGLGNGLRNKLSEAIAQKNKKSATEYVSTAYFAIIAIAVVLLCISIPLCSIIDWISLLKLPDDYHYDISLTMATLFCFFVCVLSCSWFQSYIMLCRSRYGGAVQYVRKPVVVVCGLLRAQLLYRR